MNTSPSPGSTGLPMTSKWDPERLQREITELQALEGQPLLARSKGYLRRTGPGLLQSAMTLGAGSAVASVVAGASFGYQLLWVQPVAMFLGVCMLAALGNVVLTTGERPYRAFGRELHPLIPLLWAIATIVASVIWHFPQYGLAAGAARDLAEMCGVGVYVAGAAGQRDFSAAGYAVSFGIGFLLLGISIFTTWNYGSRARGIKIYEWFLRGVIALVVLAFATVVVGTGVRWGDLFRGFFTFHLPSSPEGWQTVLGAIGAAVGINMTFLYGYSLLAKGWGEHHKQLSRWDLVMCMFLPFVAVTSLIIIAMGNTIYDPTLGEAVRTDLRPVDAARALEPVMGANLGRLVFNLGFIAMTCGAISAHMVVCGFTVCEMFKLEYTVWRYRLFTLVPAVGLLGVVTTTPLWLPVVASAICFTMLPIAYVTFLVMNNRRSYLGDAVGHGWPRAVFNIILFIAVAMSVIGAAIQIKTRVLDKLPELRGKTADEPVAGRRQLRLQDLQMPRLGAGNTCQRDTAIESHESAVMFHGKCQQNQVREVPRADHAVKAKSLSIAERESVPPKHVVRRGDRVRKPTSDIRDRDMTRVIRVRQNWQTGVLDANPRIGACGDWCSGPRIEGAFLSGAAMAGRVLGQLTYGAPLTGSIPRDCQLWLL